MMEAGLLQDSDLVPVYKVMVAPCVFSYCLVLTFSTLHGFTVQLHLLP